MSKDQIIRDTAYAMWEAEGRPDGQAETHWSRAERQIEAQLASDAGKKSKPKTDVASPATQTHEQVTTATTPKKPRAKKSTAAADAQTAPSGT